MMMVLIILLGLTGCAVVPVAVVAGGAMAGYAVAKRSGPQGLIHEMQLKAEILETWRKNNLKELPIIVNGDRVMICGYYQDDVQKHIDLITKPEVKMIDATSKTLMGETDKVKDNMLKIKVKSVLLANPLTQSRNYDITVIDEVVYLLGVAYNQQEKEEIIETVTSMKGIRHFEYDIDVKEGPISFLNRSQAS